MKTTEQIERRRAAHHGALVELAGRVGCKVDGFKLWRQLSRLERRLYVVCEHYTNATGGVDLGAWGKAKADGRVELLRIFGGVEIPAGVYINGDPRGHMLKLDCDEAPVPEGMERDWGGNGLIAPDLEEVEA
jgi:hypothetical protein